MDSDWGRPCDRGGDVRASLKHTHLGIRLLRSVLHLRCWYRVPKPYSSSVPSKYLYWMLNPSYPSLYVVRGISWYIAITRQSTPPSNVTCAFYRQSQNISCTKSSLRVVMGPVGGGRVGTGGVHDEVPRPIDRSLGAETARGLPSYYI